MIVASLLFPICFISFCSCSQSHLVLNYTRTQRTYIAATSNYPRIAVSFSFSLSALCLFTFCAQSNKPRKKYVSLVFSFSCRRKMWFSRRLDLRYISKDSFRNISFILGLQNNERICVCPSVSLRMCLVGWKAAGVWSPWTDRALWHRCKALHLISSNSPGRCPTLARITSQPWPCKLEEKDSVFLGHFTVLLPGKLFWKTSNLRGDALSPLLGKRRALNKVNVGEIINDMYGVAIGS